MANKYIDGQAHLASVDIARKWTVIGGITVDPSPPAGRLGPAYSFSASGILGKTLPHRPKWTVGRAFYIGGTDFGGELYRGEHVGTVLIFLRLESDGTISGFAGTGAGPSSLIFNTGIGGFTVSANTWFYMEIQYTLTGSAPINVAAELRINGVNVGSGSLNSNLNLTDLLLWTITGQPTVDHHHFAALASTSPTFLKDVYIFDGINEFAGNPNIDFAGDCTFYHVMPDGDITTNWTFATGGATHWDQINEIPPDGDSTYVADATPGHFDSYSFQDIPTTITNVVAIQHSAYARKDAEGTKKFTLVTGASELVSPEYSVSDDYLYYCFPQDGDPATGLAYTAAGFNAKNFGQILTV